VFILEKKIGGKRMQKKKPTHPSSTISKTSRFKPKPKEREEEEEEEEKESVESIRR